MNSLSWSASIFTSDQTGAESYSRTTNGRTKSRHLFFNNGQRVETDGRLQKHASGNIHHHARDVKDYSNAVR